MRFYPPNPNGESYEEITNGFMKYLQDFWLAFARDLRSIPISETNEFLKQNQITVSSIAEDLASDALRLKNIKRLLDSCLSYIAKGLPIMRD